MNNFSSQCWISCLGLTCRMLTAYWLDQCEWSVYLKLNRHIIIRMSTSISHKPQGSCIAVYYCTWFNTYYYLAYYFIHFDLLGQNKKNKRQQSIYACPMYFHWMRTILDWHFIVLYILQHESFIWIIWELSWAWIIFEYVRVMLCNIQHCLRNQKPFSNTSKFSRCFLQKWSKNTAFNWKGKCCLPLDLLTI